MKKIFTLIYLLFLVNACTTTKVVDIKSPCVSTDIILSNDLVKKDPCGPKKSINDWWLKSSNVTS